MKIAHIVRRYSRAEWGGTETVVANLTAEQRRRGDDPRIFATSALQPPVGTDGALTFPYFYPYFPMPSADRLALDKKGGNPYAPGLFAAVEEFRPDAIHVHAGGRLAAAAVKLARRLRIPSVVSVHGGAAEVPARELELMLRPLRRKLPYGWLADRLAGLRFDPLARAGAVLALSRRETEALAARYPQTRVEHVPNGVPPRSAEPLPPRTEFRRALCVSRIDYQKNQLAIVDLLDAEPQLEATLVGPVTAPWYHREIVARAESLGVADRLRIIPGLPPGSAELEAEFARADFFVLPSVHEPFGIVALEAMQRGLPLVAAAVGGIPDFAEDGENALLFDPHAPEGLPSAVARLDAGSAARLRAAGLATAAKYLWPKIADRIDRVYRGLMEECR